MKIGTYLVKGAGSAEDRLRAIRDAGFDFVCLGKSALEGKGITPALCERVGIPFDNIHLTCTDASLIWFEGGEGEAICERYCREIAAAAALGVHTGITHVTWRRTPVPPEDLSVGMARYERIAEAAAKYDFRVAIENSAFPRPFHAVLDRFGEPFYHCFDCGHRSCFTPEEDYLAKYGDRLVATHIHDNDGRNDLHLMPFDGVIDWAALAPEYAATEFASRMICAEFAGVGIQEYPGKSAGEIAASLSALAIDPALVKITDGAADFYPGIPYPELVGMLYGRMKKLADMIAAC